jgi:hypothetical protein
MLRLRPIYLTRLYLQFLQTSHRQILLRSLLIPSQTLNQLHAMLSAVSSHLSFPVIPRRVIVAVGDVLVSETRSRGEYLFTCFLIGLSFRPSLSWSK